MTASGGKEFPSEGMPLGPHDRLLGKGRRKSTRGKGHRQKRAPAVSEISAGGVVVRRIGGRVHVALLKTEHSRGKVWVLPKGHVERQRGETLEEAAVREVKEELGIADVRLKRKLGTTQYQFFTERGRIVKTVHYYLMDGRSDDLRPEAEEGLLEACWVPVREALRRMTYPTDREIVLRGVVRKGRGVLTKRRRRAVNADGS
jgi:ADP-ribose pyrophosphatase YjhB (NUDIX family)